MNDRSEKGSILVESTAAIPLLVFLIIGVLDITQALNIYSRINRIAYEGARYGAALPQLSRGCAAVPSNPACTQNANLAHQNILSRVQTLMIQSAFPNTLGAEISSQLNFPPPPNDSTERVVTVSVEYQYTPLFASAFGASIPIRAQSDGAYLFQAW